MHLIVKGKCNLPRCLPAEIESSHWIRSVSDLKTRDSLSVAKHRSMMRRDVSIRHNYALTLMIYRDSFLLSLAESVPLLLDWTTELY